jgi:2,4-dienoyl-CoA reductase-like NADH-dependent reductase (Old Yellow Enzyme family)/thioredoxin reductase
MPDMPETKLFEPIDIGGVTLRNRVMMAVHGPRLSQARYLRYLDERSRDVGLVGLHAFHGVMNFPFGPGPFLTSFAADPDAVPPNPLTDIGRAYYDSLIPSMAAQVDVVHGNGAKAVGQIFHLGASQHNDTFQPAIAPSVIEDEYRRKVAHELTTTELADFVAASAEAGRRALAAGMDGMEVHSAHGYLLNQFLSSRTNHRSDRYGGSLDNRLRLLCEILDAIHGATHADYPIGVRVSGHENLDEMCEVARRLADRGVAYLNVSGGTYSGLDQGAKMAYVASAYTEPGPNVAAAAAIRAAVAGRIPVIVAGRIVDLRHAEHIVEEGSADMVALVRALIADPRIVEKVRLGRDEMVNTCIGGNECHYGRSVSCAVNPAAGREEELHRGRADRPRHVVIIGGGPAGVECARQAASRGHDVRLFDEQTALGGALRDLGRHRSEFANYSDRLAAHLTDVDVVLGHRVDADELKSMAADVVVLATGSTEWIPSIPGVERIASFTALQVLRGVATLGDHVVIVGGRDDHLPPLIAADAAADGRRRVTLLTEPIVHGEGIEDATRYALTRRLLEKSVDIRAMTALHEVRDGELVLRNTFTNSLSTLSGVDTVIFASGRRSRLELFGAVAGAQPIGDALAPRRMLHATLDGARLGATI